MYKLKRIEYLFWLLSIYRYFEKVFKTRRFDVFEFSKGLSYGYFYSNTINDCRRSSPRDLQTTTTASTQVIATGAAVVPKQIQTIIINRLMTRFTIVLLHKYNSYIIKDIHLEWHHRSHRIILDDDSSIII